MSTRPGQVRSAISIGANGRYLSEGVRNMVRVSRVIDANDLRVVEPETSKKPANGFVYGFDVSPVLWAPTVSAWGFIALGGAEGKALA